MEQPPLSLHFSRRAYEEIKVVEEQIAYALRQVDGDTEVAATNENRVFLLWMKEAG